MVEDLPYDTENCCLDAHGAAALIRARQPRLVMLGRSVMIRPDDLKPVITAARDTGATTIFDASHVSGLIAGGTFPNPLTLGVDIMTSSTYKTIPGRPHALIARRDAQQGAHLAEFLDRTMLANYDAGKLPALLVTLVDFKANGADYARRVCQNAQALAQGLRRLDVAIIAPEQCEGFTHQILVPLDFKLDPSVVIARLEKHGILVGTCADPCVSNGFALRLGTQFLTSQGQDVTDMASIAGKLAAVLSKQCNLRMGIN